MTMIEKLNAIVRFSLYTMFLFIVFLKKYQVIWFPLCVMVFTVWFYNDSSKRIETYLTTENLPDKEFYKNYTKSKECTMPTYENPMMNANLITYPRNRLPACKTWNNTSVEEDVNEKLNYNLYRDVSDVWDKMTLKRTFYTMPSTTIPNDQTSFAKWCYNTGPTCKEKTGYCASPLWPPNINHNIKSFVNPI
jgi:Ca2+/Na+ antiporter